MKLYKEGRYTGERALYETHDAKIENCIFDDGESPLKESSNLDISHTSFCWKYPLWYDKNVKVEHSTFFEMARAGVWYTQDITLNDVLICAPKNFRRCKELTLKDVTFTDAKETLFNCEDVKLINVSAKGDYFGMHCSNMDIENLKVDGNYAFDSAKNATFKNCKLLTKDAFWNCENINIEHSYICGEYFGWNSKNITLKDCTIESLQGFCYMENVKLINCKVLNTNLAFEYSTVDADITTRLISIKNPKGGRIVCRGYDELIMEPNLVDPSKTEIIVKE